MNPLCTSGLKVSEEVLVDREDVGKRNGLETRISLFGGLGENKERDGTQNDGVSLNAHSIGLIEFFDSLVEVQLEFSLL